MKDIRGTEIEVGDTIALPQRRGSSCWLGIYEVSEIKDTGGLFGRGVLTYFNPKLEKPRHYMNVKAPEDVVVVAKASATP